MLFNEDKESIITAQEIIDHITQKEKKKTVIVKPDIFIYGKEHITKLQETGNIGNSIAYSCALSKLKSYVNKDNLTFEEINYKFLESFNASMLADNIKLNTISLYLRTIRALFNKAIKDGTLEARFYPFSNFKIKTEQTISRALTSLEMAKIASLKLPENTPIWHQKSLFLLSFCFIGINLADLLTLTRENLVDGRIVFRRKKTHKVYSIQIQGKAMEILNFYFKALPDNNRDFLLPFVVQKNNPIQLKKDIHQAIKNCNDYLAKVATQCKIDKLITTYYARYSWANIAKSLGYSKDMIAEALGHQYGNKVTGIYLDNYDNETIDSMNGKVIEAVFEN
ncbi:MAG: hypothetical protein E6H08_16530 [Bacteroidetes bacterium]|nr:MAG: hypothetical protein E6H08_16530 [Bacteroidota bacterium]